MKKAVHEFNGHSKCENLVLNFAHHGSSGAAAYVVNYLVDKIQVQAILGPLTQLEAALVSDFDEAAYRGIPIISVNPATTYSPLLFPPEPLSLIQMNNDVTSQMQCFAALIGLFKWRKVIALYEAVNNFSMDSVLITHLSDSLQVFESTVEYHLAFPPLVSLSDSRLFIQQELEKFRSKNVEVFVVIQCTLHFSLVLFYMEKQIGMMGQDYAWIISDSMASLLDSIEPSLLLNMQGVIGFKAYVPDNRDLFRVFNVRFRRKYRSEYPEEEGNPSPSSYALKAYDATWATAKAIRKSLKEKTNSSELVKIIESSDFEGLSGNISFKNGVISRNPVFTIINVFGKSYREVSFWPSKFGFFDDLIEHNGAKLRIGNCLGEALGSILWQGGKQTVLRGWTIGGLENPLKIGVPARGALINL